MKTSAISPTPKASVTITPKHIASQPAPLMSESPMPAHTAAITVPITSTTAMATNAATQFSVDFIAVLPYVWRPSARNRCDPAKILDEPQDLALAGLLARSSQQRRGMHGGKRIGRQCEWHEAAAVPRHTKGLAEHERRHRAEQRPSALPGSSCGNLWAVRAKIMPRIEGLTE